MHEVPLLSAPPQPLAYLSPVVALALLQILLVHGVLHLLGYDHEESEEEHTEMAAAERKLMARLGWKGAGLIDATDVEA